VLIIYVKTVLISAKYVDGSFGAKFLDLKSLVILVSGIEHTSNLA